MLLPKLLSTKGVFASYVKGNNREGNRGLWPVILSGVEQNYIEFTV
jgi:hypothetical protein